MAIAVVIGGHVAVLALLAIQEQREAGNPPDPRMTLVFLDPLEETSPALPIESPRRQAMSPRSITVPPVPAATPVPGDSTAITPNVDWYAHGANAAQRAATEPPAPAFGFPKRAPAPREKKEFGWDKTHTERVHALDGGGIGIHLSDNCDLILAPFPMAGCALGKRKARGDLFDEMTAPVAPGDWKDR